MDVVAGRYQLEGTLGEGGSAVVVRAKDLQTGEHVAMKRMRETAWRDTARRRFEVEARILSELRHPHLARVYDAGRDAQDVPYIVMELLEGGTLAKELGKHPMDPKDALALVLPLLGALAIAHDAGVLHRDVKPSNIFLRTLHDAPKTPMLLDFGIAKQLGEAGQTSDGVVVGTPAYMSPEQAAGECLGPETDVWSIAVVLYRLLAGRLPFEGDSARDVLGKVCRGNAPVLASVCPSIPRGLAAIVDRALRPIDSRPRSTREFANLLLHAAVADGVDLPVDPDPVGLPEWSAWLATANAECPTGEIPKSAAPRPTKACMRKRALLAVAAVGLLTLGIGAAASLGQTRSSGPPAVDSSTMSTVLSTTTAPALADREDVAEAAPDAGVVGSQVVEAQPVGTEAGHVECDPRTATRVRGASAQRRPAPSPVVPASAEVGARPRPVPDVIDTWDL